MSFSNPTDSEYVDVESGKYIAQVASLDDGDDYGNGPTIIWVMNLADNSGPLYNAEGGPLQHRALSSQSLGKRAKARQWAEAFLGQSIAGMTGDEVTEALVGTVANVLIGPVSTVGADGVAVTRQRILSVEPLSAAAAPAKPALKREPVGAGANPFSTPV